MEETGISAGNRNKLPTHTTKQNANPTASGEMTVYCETRELRGDAKISSFTTVLSITKQNHSCHNAQLGEQNLSLALSFYDPTVREKGCCLKKGNKHTGWSREGLPKSNQI